MVNCLVLYVTQTGDNISGKLLSAVIYYKNGENSVQKTVGDLAPEMLLTGF